MNFFRDLKENLSKNDTFSKLANDVTEFVGELAETLMKGGNEADIVTKIGIENKLTLVSESEIDKARTDILKELANSTKDEGELYYIFNKVRGEDSYRVWKIEGASVSQTEMKKSDLPADITVNSILRKEGNDFIVDKETTREVESSIRKRANEIIYEQNRKIDEYKKEGHTYLVTEDTNGRIFLWDSTEKPKFEIEDVNFPEQLKDRAMEGNSFLFKNGTYVHIS